MQRRDFMGFLAQATVLPTAAWVMGKDNVLALPAQRMPLLYTEVAGFRHYQQSEFLQRLAPRMLVTLLREPLNSHDDKAIALFVGAEKIGYIPRYCNRALAEVMDRGHAVQAEVEEVQAEAAHWYRPIHVAVWVEGLSPPVENRGQSTVS